MLKPLFPNTFLLNVLLIFFPFLWTSGDRERKYHSQAITLIRQMLLFGFAACGISGQWVRNKIRKKYIYKKNNKANLRALKVYFLPVKRDFKCNTCTMTPFRLLFGVFISRLHNSQPVFLSFVPFVLCRSLS